MVVMYHHNNVTVWKYNPVTVNSWLEPVSMPIRGSNRRVAPSLSHGPVVKSVGSNEMKVLIDTLCVG